MKVSSLNRFRLFFSILLVGSNPTEGEGPASRSVGGLITREVI
jgi:hypothetical protein